MSLPRPHDEKNHNNIQHDIEHAVHAGVEVYSKFSHSPAARLLHRLHKPAQIIDNFFKASAYYNQNRERGYSPAMSVAGATIGVAAKIGVNAVGTLEVGTGLALGTSGAGSVAAPFAVAAGAYTYKQSTKIADQANFAGPIVLDAIIEGSQSFYRSTMEFIEVTSRTLACYPPAQPAKTYVNLETAMADHGYFDRAEALFAMNGLGERDIPLYNLMSYQVFSDYYKLNSSGELVRTDKPLAPSAEVKSSVNTLKQEIETAKRTLQGHQGEQQVHLPAAQQNVLAAHQGLQRVVQRQAGNAPFCLTNDDRVNLNHLSGSCKHLGSIITNVADGAIMLGGHARTWRGVSGVGQGFMSAASGFAAVGGAPSFTSLAAIGGYVGIALGALSIAMSLMGGDDEEQDESLAIIMGALQAMHRDFMQGFRQLEHLITQNAAVILHRLNQVNAKLDRLERLFTISLKELHGKELIDIADTLTKEMNGECVLNDAEKHNLLMRLSTWIDHHSKAQLQTASVRITDDASKCAEILASSDFDIASMFPFFVSQLAQILPTHLAELIPSQELPNIVVLSAACEVYASAISRYQVQDKVLPLLERAKASFDSIDKIIALIKTNPEFLEVLFRQYDYHRFHVGRSIANCLSEITVKTNVTLAQNLKTGMAQEQLKHDLEQLEMCRLMLVKLQEICNFDHNTAENINKLESKNDILERHTSLYAAEAAKKWDVLKNGTPAEFKRVLEMGASLNDWDLGVSQAYAAQPIHHLTRTRLPDRYTYTPTLLHLMLKVNGLDVNTSISAGIPYRGRVTAYQMMQVPQYSAVDLMLNNGDFDLLILMCAHGIDIATPSGTPTDWKFIVQQELIAEMNNPISKINKKDLREAYQFYRAVEAGGRVSSSGISVVCVLVLAAILDDMKPVYALTNHAEIKSSFIQLTPSFVTVLMLAINCGSKSVFDYLQSKGYPTQSVRGFEEGHYDYTKRYLKVRSPLLYIAIERQQWEIAKTRDMPSKIYQNYPGVEEDNKVVERYKAKLAEGLKSTKVVQIKAPLYSLSWVKLSPHQVMMKAVNPNTTHPLIELVMSGIDRLNFAIASLGIIPVCIPSVSPAASLSLSRPQQKSAFLFAIDINALQSLYEYLNDLSGSLKEQGAFIADEKATFATNYANLNRNLAGLKVLVSDSDWHDYKQLFATLNLIPIALNTIDVVFKSKLSIPYKYKSNVKYATKEVSRQLKLLLKQSSANQVAGQATQAYTRETLFKSSSPMVSANNQQLGWNCFDLAVGLGDRQKFVEHAILYAPMVGYRNLLAPEIKLATTLPPEELTALPASMRNDVVKRIVENYQEAHERMRPAVAACNDALNHPEGCRISLGDLVKFFEDPANIIRYKVAHTSFMQAYASIYEPASNAFNLYASRITTYCQYIREYYGKGGWFVFHNAFAGETQKTSMVDIAALYLNAKIVIYLVNGQNNAKVYETAVYGDKVIEINYNGVNHFTKRDNQPALRMSNP